MFIRLYSYLVGETAMGEISIGSLINPSIWCNIYSLVQDIIVATNAIVNFWNIKICLICPTFDHT